MSPDSTKKFHPAILDPPTAHKEQEDKRNPHDHKDDRESKKVNGKDSSFPRRRQQVFLPNHQGGVQDVEKGKEEEAREIDRVEEEDTGSVIRTSNGWAGRAFFR